MMRTEIFNKYLRPFTISFLSAAIIVSLSTYSLSQEDIIHMQISGAGPSTEAVTILAHEFTKDYPHYQIKVPSKSIKHLGGLEWALLHKQIFGRLGRPLSSNDMEKFPNAREIPIAKIRLAFAVSKDLGVSRLKFEDWQNIYLGKITNWQEIGGPDKKIILLGREEGEASLQSLIKDYPFWNSVKFIKKYKKDHLIIKAIGKVPGSIGFASSSGLAKNMEVTVLNIEGFTSGHEIGLVYNVNNEATRVVQLMKKFIKTPKWRDLLIENGFLPVIK